MKLSTRSRYGLIAIVDLASAYTDGKPVPLSVLAQSQGVSEDYLEQLLRLLKKADIVRASRGMSGGYSLTHAPEEINVAMVLNALEGSTSLTDCVGTTEARCDKACTCSARPLFLKLQNRIDSVLYSTTIMDLANDNIQQKRRMENYAKSISR